MQKGTTKSKGQKNSLDKFYTKKTIAKQCIDFLKLTDFDLIIEPSAGGGSFSTQINGCMAYDLEPEQENIIEQDWLQLDKTQFQTYKNILVIGNPPYGQQNNLAVKFFNESATFAHTIAFILPLSFQKDSIQNRLNKQFHLIHSYVLPLNSFTLNDQDYSVPTIFQVWQKKEVTREKLNYHTDFDGVIFVQKNENPDIRVQRVGGNAGKAYLDFDKAESSNYFLINKTGLTNQQLIDIVNQINFASINHTVGPKSLPKNELIYYLAKYCTNSKV